MEKRFKHGLVLGKFLPPTLGHYFLIDSAINQCENVYVMVCSTENDAITGLLRTLWLTSKYASANVRIINYANDNPQYPNEAESLDDFYIKYWVPAVYDRIENLDVVFTSEDYGEEYAYYLGVKHVLVDKNRTKYPVCGSGVLKNPDAYWNYIPEVVKNYLKRKIVVIGPESTGKSTLVAKFSKYYTNSVAVTEFGREYTEEVPSCELIVDDFEEIASNHKSLIEEATNKDKRLIFVDTEAITTKTFGEMYLGDEFESPFIDDIIDEQTFDLWLLLDIDVPWVDDGTRDFPHLRKKHMNKIKSVLEQHNIPYVLINGDYNERFNKAVDEIDKL